MGSCSCQVSAVIEINKKEEENSITSKKLLSSSIKKLDIESMIEEQKKEYPDMEEWEGDKYKGIGIKRMKGYKCDLPIDKLIKNVLIKPIIKFDIVNIVTDIMFLKKKIFMIDYGFIDI